MADTHDADRFLPLNPRALVVLLGLAEGDAHGYEIKKRAERQSAGSVSLDVGSLYRTLAQFLADGLIDERAQPRGANGGDPRRRYYALTDLGREVLAAELRRLAGLVEFARAAALLERPEGGR